MGPQRCEPRSLVKERVTWLSLKIGYPIGGRAEARKCFLTRRILTLRVQPSFCRHVALDGYPILFASRDEPVSAEDSGWQFLCNSGEGENDEARTWAISTVLRHDPTLLGIVFLPAGTTVVRSSGNHGWKAI